MSFFRFRQNNSGGSFVQNDKVDVTVFVEAEDADAANERAESIGLYFDGCRVGRDCSCCGDRWYRAWENSALTHAEMLEEYDWDTDRVVYYADGRVERSK